MWATRNVAVARVNAQRCKHHNPQTHRSVQPTARTHPRLLPSTSQTTLCIANSTSQISFSFLSTDCFLCPFDSFQRQNIRICVKFVFFNVDTTDSILEMVFYIFSTVFNVKMSEFVLNWPFLMSTRQILS